MESLAQLYFVGRPIHLSLNLHRPSISKPRLPLSSIALPKSSSSPSSKGGTIRASSSPANTLYEIPQNPTLSLLKTTLVALTAAAAVFFARLHNRPALAAAVAAPPPSMAEPSEETNENGGVSFEREERALEQHLASHPNDVEALRSLMEVRIKSNKLRQAIAIIDRLIEIVPDEREWPVLKAQIHTYSGDYDSARNGFEEILAKDPLRVEAYHGLVTSYAESGSELSPLEKRINEAMDKCKKESENKKIRDFKLLIAQIRIIEGNPSEALKVYQELVKEEPRDFRPYLCQGLIYTLLRKKEEAEKQFEQFRKLVPENHPYKEYIADKLLSAKKLFGESAQE